LRPNVSPPSSAARCAKAALKKKGLRRKPGTRAMFVFKKKSRRSEPTNIFTSARTVARAAATCCGLSRYDYHVEEPRLPAQVNISPAEYPAIRGGCPRADGAPLERAVGVKAGGAKAREPPSRGVSQQAFERLRTWVGGPIAPRGPDNHSSYIQTGTSLPRRRFEGQVSTTTRSWDVRN
jgi:hypothetical protein